MSWYKKKPDNVSATEVFLQIIVQNNRIKVILKTGFMYFSHSLHSFYEIIPW